MTGESDGQALIAAIRAGEREQVRKLLDADPTVVNAHADSGESAVLLATYYGHRDIADLLIARGATLSLFEASATGQIERVRKLVQADPSLINQFSADGFTALGLACFFGHAALVDDLLAKGAQVNVASRNPLNVMPLHSAVASQQLAISRALLEHGADVNATQQDHYTPLHEAAQNGQLEMIELLFRFGANPNLRSDSGETPAGVALKAGKTDAAELIRRHGGT